MPATTSRSHLVPALLFAGLFLGAASAAAETPAPDAKFVIEDEGGFGRTAVEAVRAELHAGLATLAGLGFAPRNGLYPIKVRLMPGGGVSNSFSGVLVLYQLGRNEAPIVHELTHVVAGYDSSLGHWTQEGLASFMQDRHGSNEAYPTYRLPHALARLVADKDELLPMKEVMHDRRRQRYFGIARPWERWLAYVQSTSFVTWLIDVYGLDRFRRIYNRPVEDIDFVAAYGKSSDALTADWMGFVRGQDRPSARAEALYNRTYAFTHRQMGR
jgi:hypothetical protein